MHIKALFLILALPALAACQSNNIQVIPQPVAVLPGDGEFNLKSDTRVYSPKGDADWALAVAQLRSIFSASTGYKLENKFFTPKDTAQKTNAIYFIPDNNIKHAEGYQLDIKSGFIAIRARTAAGAFYAVQTLRQLFPPEINNSQKTERKEGWAAPVCTIFDEPRFTYRGMHLDVGRHFFPADFVKRYIDLLAMHKINTFHWHLTEDQGWRIEIKKYPKLQTIAACRNETLVGHYSDTPQKFDGVKYCGYYTQAEVKEIVEYARKHFITIIPEIEMPGHALAALSAYPELGCTGGPYQAATKWGVFDDVFCAGNEETFKFLDGVLEEVCALFPGPYVHIGGDECPKTRWEACPKCQKRIHDEGLKDTHELQSYFIHRAETMLAKYGKKLIGWDEILEGGLAPSATVMSWRGTEGGIAAAKAGHNAIMTPNSAVYFDYYQGDPATEPVAIGGYLPIEKVYAYEPVPADFTPEEAGHILGVQGNIWTEYIATPDYLEYMVFPRACALAELAWTAPARKNWLSFSQRLLAHFPRLDAIGLHYAHSVFDVTSAFTGGKVSLNTSIADLEIRYTVDGSVPTATSKRFTAPFSLKSSGTVKAAVFKRGKMIGNVHTVDYLLHKASGKPYTLSKNPEKYTGGEQYALTNGVVGGIKTWNNWVALVNHDIDPVIDFGENTRFDKVTAHFVNAKVAWIYPPRSVQVYSSDDGVNFTLLANQDIDVEKMDGISIETVNLDTPGAKGRYLKFVAATFGVIPADAPGAGNGAWLFCDEIMVE